MGLLEKQRGMTAIGWLFVLGFIAIVVMVVLKLAPVYLENYSVDSTIRHLGDNGTSYASVGEVRNAIQRRFMINQVERVNMQDVIISREGNQFLVQVQYEVRVPFAFNLDFVVSFDDHGEAPAG